MSPAAIHKELAFEDEICADLPQRGWLYVKDDSLRYDRARALFPEDVLAWVQGASPEAWASLEKNHGGKAGEVLLDRLRHQLNQLGTLEVLRHGIEMVGVKGRIRFGEFKPAFNINPDIVGRYQANRLRVARQVRYSLANENCIDLVLFLNGIPVATVELKTDFTQSIDDAIDQYRFDRHPKPKGSAPEPLLSFPGGALVRGAAMMSHGSGAASAAAHVTVNAVLWIACAALAAAFSLGITNPVAMTIGAGGLTGVVGCSWWLATRAGIGVALAALALRMIGLVFAGLRLLAAFMAIGIVTGFIDLYPFVFATILGSAASIAPGGLGISEIVAAGIATLSTIPPEAAFVAVGLNRVIGFAVSGIATGIITLFFADQRTTQ